MIFRSGRPEKNCPKPSLITPVRWVKKLEESFVPVGGEREREREREREKRRERGKRGEGEGGEGGREVVYIHVYGHTCTCTCKTETCKFPYGMTNHSTSHTHLETLPQCPAR